MEVIPLKQSKKVLLALITLTLISSLYCQEDTGTSPTPLLYSTPTDRETSGTTDGTIADPRKTAGEQAGDGPIIEPGSTATSATSNMNPYATSISTLVSRAPDAENAFFTDTGRLFVTDGTSISEITNRETVNRLFTDNRGIFGGIAQSGKWLYVLHATVKNPLPAMDLNSCIKSGSMVKILLLLTDLLMDKELLRADITVPGNPVFTSIYKLKDVVLPNGMAADAEGNLYVANQTFLPQGAIVKLTITGNAQPAVTQETWISYKNGCLSPNGIVIRDTTLYFTDFSIWSSKPAKVKKVAITNGRPGPVETVYSAASFFDDLDVAMYRNEPQIAVADYLMNSIILINANDGTKTRLGSGTVANPSSVHFGVAPRFRANELVITEKGILYEMYSSYGNKLSCMTISE